MTEKKKKKAEKCEIIAGVDSVNPAQALYYT